jgi:ankyrin repeat protein
VNDHFYPYAFTALHSASQYGDLPVAKWLLANNTKVVKDKYAGTVLHLATENGHLALVRLLVRESDVDVSVMNIHGETAFHIAVKHGHSDIAKCLLHGRHVDVSVRTGARTMVTMGGTRENYPQTK